MKKKFLKIVFILVVLLITLFILALYNERNKDIFLIKENQSIEAKQELENQNLTTAEILSQETETIQETTEDVVEESTVEKITEEVVVEKEKTKVTNEQPKTQSESKKSNSESSNKTKDNLEVTTEKTKVENEEVVESNTEKNTEEEINYKQETTEETKNNETEQEEINETPKCNHDEEKWFNSKAEAEAIYYKELEKWDEFVRHENVTVEEYMEYINNCPTGYEVWSCPYCQKWTINMYYKK